MQQRGSLLRRSCTQAPSGRPVTWCPSLARGKATITRALPYSLSMIDSKSRRDPDKQPQLATNLRLFLDSASITQWELWLSTNLFYGEHHWLIDLPTLRPHLPYTLCSAHAALVSASADRLVVYYIVATTILQTNNMSTCVQGPLLRAARVSTPPSARSATSTPLSAPLSTRPGITTNPVILEKDNQRCTLSNLTKLCEIGQGLGVKEMQFQVGPATPLSAAAAHTCEHMAHLMLTS